MKSQFWILLVITTSTTLCDNTIGNSEQDSCFLDSDNSCTSPEYRRHFPPGFLFGASSASYQIEGAWNEDNKGENIWDNFTHKYPHLVDDFSNGDVACDSYHKWKEDVAILKEVGVDFYRFSLSWSRILSNGYKEAINQRGIDHYNGLIDALLENGIQPVVALDHWDLPQHLQDKGGWTNPELVDLFKEYARVVFLAFGDRVEHWLTFNQAATLCVDGYGSDRKPPMINQGGVAEYLCGHNILKAHASAYHLYHDELKMNGTVSIILTAQWYNPASESPEDLEAAERCNQFEVGWFANPIFSKAGDYPMEMKKTIEELSLQQGYNGSRLPSFSASEVEFIKGTSDYFGINHYTTNACRSILGRNLSDISYEGDRSAEVFQEEDWPETASGWLKVVPWGFEKLLKWIKKTYDNPTVFVYENGVSDRGTLEDDNRIDFYRKYINAMLDAMDEGCEVIGFAIWSIMDNFEWRRGYTERFGIYSVNFSDPDRTRTAKKSANFYKNLIARRWIAKE